MLRTVTIVIGVFVLGAANLLADDDQTPKSIDKAELKKQGDQQGAEKIIKADKPKGDEKKPLKEGEGKDGEKRPVKAGEKEFVKEDGKKLLKNRETKPGVAVIASETEYYTSSPAQGRPADGKLKPGTKVRVLEKAGSYVRVVAQLEVFVPADSLKQQSEKKESVKKGDGEKSPSK